VSEQGDKMDDTMFLQYCARLKKKYNLLTVTRIDQNLLYACLCPTKLSQREAKLRFASDISLPDITDHAGWLDETKQHVMVALAENPVLLAKLVAGDQAPESPQRPARPDKQDKSSPRPSTASTASGSSGQGSHYGTLPVYGDGLIIATALLKESGQANVY